MGTANISISKRERLELMRRLGSKGSSGASRGSLRRGASFKVEKAHFAAWRKGPEKQT